jgi:hypothetical protein
MAITLQIALSVTKKLEARLEVSAAILAFIGRAETTRRSPLTLVCRPACLLSDGAAAGEEIV